MPKHVTLSRGTVITLRTPGRPPVVIGITRPRNCPLRATIEAEDEVGIQVIHADAEAKAVDREKEAAADREALTAENSLLRIRATHHEVALLRLEDGRAITLELCPRPGAGGYAYEIRAPRGVRIERAPSDRVYVAPRAACYDEDTAPCSRPATTRSTRPSTPISRPTPPPAPRPLSGRAAAMLRRHESEPSSP